MPPPLMRAPYWSKPGARPDLTEAPHRFVTILTDRGEFTYPDQWLTFSDGWVHRWWLTPGNTPPNVLSGEHLHAPTVLAIRTVD